jgi:hypothetical protein
MARNSSPDHTPIPHTLRSALRYEQMELIQSYKGLAVLQCKVCTACTVVEVDESADWSCPSCASLKFEAVCGHLTWIGTRNERPYPCPLRDGSDSPDRPVQWTSAA